MVLESPNFENRCSIFLWVENILIFLKSHVSSFSVIFRRRCCAEMASIPGLQLLVTREQSRSHFNDCRKKTDLFAVTGEMLVRTGKTYPHGVIEINFYVIKTCSRCNFNLENNE